MDKCQSEVTDKIRSAIKEKLIEINVFVDNELPDYIMILIANKRSKHHMEKDLSLFLGSQTEDFTNWLWDLVNSFKAGAKSRNPKGNVNFDLELSRTIESKENRADEDDVLNYDPAEEGETLCLEEMNEPSSNEQKETRINPAVLNASQLLSNNSQVIQAVVKTECPITPTKSPIEVLSATIPQVQVPIKQEVSGLLQERSTLLALPSKISQKSAKVYPMQRSLEILSNAKERQNDISSLKPELTKGVSSVVCISQRKYGRPAALQANKLLLKAVNDATKSVLNGRDINDFYKPTPIKVLESNKEKVSDLKFEKHQDIEVNTIAHIVSETVEPATNNFNINDTNIDIDTNINVDIINQEHYQPSARTISLPLVNTSIEMLEDSNNFIPVLSESLKKEIPVTPHFIVTLDGVKLSSLKRKHSVEEAMEIDEEEEDDDEEESEDSDEFSGHVREKKQKLVERCKYWPACKNSDSCAFHHPTISCKCFPDCKFGDKCLYIHPNCKFDSLCSRKDCPYTHCSKRRFKSIPSVVRPTKIPSSKIVCKYYPKCTAKSCKFIHPKLCRYGTQCRAPKCLYGHFQIPQRNLLKWKASSA